MSNHTAPKPYKDQYLIYARKSTDDSENQKNSLAYQITEAVKYAKTTNLRIAEVTIPGFCTFGQIRERHTGFKEDKDFDIDDHGMVSYKIERPKFYHLIRYLKEGSFKGVIFLCWDRASRNKNDDGLLRKLMKQNDIHFIQTQYDAQTSSGELHMDIDGTFAQHYSRVISEKVRNQNRKLREEGIYLSKAPVGYLNTGDSRNKPIDPVRAPLIKSLFGKYAEGTWTLIELAEWANKHGLTMPPSRRKRTAEEMLADEEITIEPICRPVTYKNVHTILTNAFYIGKIRDSSNQWRESISHKPLVTETLFNRVQEILKSKKVSVHYIEKPYFPYRGLLRCGQCRRVYTPYEQKGIHYYGARCEKGCLNTKRNINAKYIEDKVGEALRVLFFTDKEKADINYRIKKDLRQLEEKRKSDLAQNEHQKRKLREDLTYLHENKLTLLKSSVYTPEAFKEEEFKLNQQLQALQNEEQASDIALHEVVKDLILLSELLKDAYLYYCSAKQYEKKLLIQTVFYELYLDGNVFQYKTKNGFNLLESRFMSSGAPCTWISELVNDYPLIKSSIEDLKSWSLST